MTGGGDEGLPGHTSAAIASVVRSSSSPSTSPPVEMTASPPCGNEFGRLAWSSRAGWGTSRRPPRAEVNRRVVTASDVRRRPTSTSARMSMPRDRSQSATWSTVAASPTTATCWRPSFRFGSRARAGPDGLQGGGMARGRQTYCPPSSTMTPGPGHATSSRSREVHRPSTRSGRFRRQGLSTRRRRQADGSLRLSGRGARVPRPGQPVPVRATGQHREQALAQSAASSPDVENPPLCACRR